MSVLYGLVYTTVRERNHVISPGPRHNSGKMSGTSHISGINPYTVITPENQGYHFDHIFNAILWYMQMDFPLEKYVVSGWI